MDEQPEHPTRPLWLESPPNPLPPPPPEPPRGDGDRRGAWLKPALAGGVVGALIAAAVAGGIVAADDDGSAARPAGLTRASSRLAGEKLDIRDVLERVEPGV